MKSFSIALLVFVLVLELGCEDNKRQTDTKTNIEQDSLYLKRGQQVVATAFKNLSGRLKEAIQKEGVQKAIRYCNFAADPLIDSLSKIHQVKIMRTSHRLRNPDNKPSQSEKNVLSQYMEDQNNKKIPHPFVQSKDKKVNYYAPIILMKNCLRCHGEIGKDIQAKDYAVISELYPDDKATGFKVGELRGIWSLEFEKSLK